MGRRKIPTGQPIIKALACGMLEDNGRVLFLVRRDEYGAERIEMPCVIVPSGLDPLFALKQVFQEQTGIDAQIHEVIIEAKYNAGTRRKKNFVPCLIFKVTAKARSAKPSSAFAGARWLSIKDAKEQKLSRNCEWLRFFRPA